MISDGKRDEMDSLSSGRMTLSHDEVLITRRFVGTVIIAIALLMLDAITPMGLGIWLLQVALMWITSRWANRRQILVIAVLCSTFTALAFWWSPNAGVETWISATNLLLSVGAVCAIAHTAILQRTAEEARRRASEQAAASEAQIKILAGLLPICSSCKKIRNEDGEWEQLEAYISTRSEARFSHGFCKPCMAQLYPDLFLPASQPETEETQTCR
jgi:hypothetical protein